MKLRTILYGYTFQNAGYIPDPSESTVVKSIYSNYIGGITMAEIAKHLSEADIPYSPNKRTWDKNMVYRILTDARYIGEGVYPQIISKDTSIQKINELTDVLQMFDGLLLLTKTLQIVQIDIQHQMEKFTL